MPLLLAIGVRLGAPYIYMHVVIVWSSKNAWQSRNEKD